MEGIIYCYKSPANKYYVGQTISEIERKRSHKINTSKTKTKFGLAINKYGFENFEYRVLIRISSTDKDFLHSLLDKFEIMFISIYDSYKNGYNSTLGGCTNFGNLSCIRSVDQYSLTGEYIATYTSIAEAGREVGVSGDRITSVCSDSSRSKSTGGYLWKYSDNLNNICLKDISKIYQYDLNMNLLFTYSTLVEASEKTGISNHMLTKNVNGQCKQTHSFIFKREIVTKGKQKKINCASKSNRKSITVTDKQGLVLYTFNSIAEAAKEFGCTEKMMSSVCNGRRKSYKKLLFKFNS